MPAASHPSSTQRHPTTKTHKTNDIQMVFSDLFFLYVFLPAFALLYLLGTWADKRHGDKCTLRNAVLVAFSLIFYAWGEPIYVFLMLATVVANYVAGRFIDRQDKSRKTALVLGVTFNILVLAVFKYADFFAHQLQAIGLPVPSPGIALPIGISFYIFQSISYLVDVYRRESPAQRRFIHLLLYISMFPQLIAGPIVRYGTVAGKLHKRNVTVEDVSEGVYKFLRGLAKKVILANQLYEVSHQFLDGDMASLTVSGAWIGIVAFTLQIYFDFSGYSDMAIGLGRCMGFRFNENFEHPYCSRSITEFWRRWHISLGSFFRDYVYIPLGGNRRHQILNILVVWFLTGFWHGASWNFIIWGLYYGFIVVVEKYTIKKVADRVPSVLLHVYTIFLVVLGFCIFYYDNFDKMSDFFRISWGGAAVIWDGVSEAALTDRFWLWITAIALCMPLRSWAGGKIAKATASRPHSQAAIALTIRTLLSTVIIVLSTALLVGATNNAFIYTRF